MIPLDDDFQKKLDSFLETPEPRDRNNPIWKEYLFRIQSGGRPRQVGDLSPEEIREILEKPEYQRSKKQ